MIRRPLAAALLLLAVPHRALAEPAVIRVFEAAARGEPAKDAPVLQVFPEKAEVSVSEEATGGWRRVRVQDGRVGWIEESALAFPAKAAAAAAAPVTAPAPTAATLATPAPAGGAPAASPAAAAPAPDLRPHIYVKDLGHLAELVKDDANVSPTAQKLAARRRGAIGVAIAGGLASVVAIAAGVSKWSSETRDPSDPNFMESTGGEKLFVGGVVGSLATAAVSALIYPRRGEVLDVINAWNVAHPDRQFEIRRSGVQH
jgi:hypothetical protein